MWSSYSSAAASSYRKQCEVGTQSVSPLYMSIDTGNLEAAKVGGAMQHPSCFLLLFLTTTSEDEDPFHCTGDAAGSCDNPCRSFQAASAN